MQLTLSIAIMQKPTSVAIIQFLRFYCNYVGHTFCYIYVGEPLCCNYAGDCFCCNYAVRSSCSIYAGEISFCSKYVGDHFYWNYACVSLCCYHTGTNFTVHYAHDCFYCNYAGESLSFFFVLFFVFLIVIHSMQGWTASTRHWVTRKRSTKRLQHIGNLFRKNLQLKDIC